MDADWVNLFELEERALARLGPVARDYYAAGAEDGVTLRRNRAAFEELSLAYRVLVDVAERDLAVELLGRRIALPVLAAPTAFQRMAHPEGERAAARAAGEAGTVFVLSTLSNTSIEDVARAATGPLWFQLYVYRDREATRDLVRRAEEAGCEALVLTVDAPIWGRREPDIRNRFALPADLRVENLTAAGMQDLPAEATGSGLAAYIASFLDPSLTWADLEWLCGVARVPVLVKGIVRADDAGRALGHGAAGVVVSNHGGRQLDTAPATIEVLPEIAAAVDGRGALLLDGGVRRGTDVVKALALGADAVLVGRPVLWGLAVGGAEGVARMFAALRHELDVALGLCGARSPAELRPDLVRFRPDRA